MSKITQSAPVSGTARGPIACQRAPMANAKIISLLDHASRNLDRQWAEDLSTTRGWTAAQIGEMTMILRHDTNVLNAIVRRLCAEVDKLQIDLAALTTLKQEGAGRS